MKKLLTLLLAIVIVLAVAAPAFAEEEKVTITWGLYETDNLTAELWDSVIDAFEAEYPNINVEKVVAVGDDRIQFWLSLYASGSFPDIVMEADQVCRYDANVFAELPADVIDLFEEGAIASYGGKTVTVPYSKQLRMQVYYNKADYEALGLKEPATYEEFVANCAALKEAGKTPLICGGTGDVWATGQPWWIATTNQSILCQEPDFLAKVNAGELEWTYPAIVKSMEDWKALIDAGYYHPGCMSWSYSQAAAEFQNGGATMMIDGSWAAAGFDAAGNEDFGVFVLPNPDGAQADGYCCPISYWGVSASSKNEEAVWTFIKWFFSSKDAYANVLKADGLNSTTKEAVTYELGPVATKMVQNLEGLKLYPEIHISSGDNVCMGDVVNVTCKAMQLIFTGMDPVEALQMVQDEQNMAME